LATLVIASLALYNLLLADLIGFKTLNLFIETISDPPLAIEKRKTDNENISVIIDQIRSLLNDKLDILVRILEVSSPSVFDRYKRRCYRK